MNDRIANLQILRFLAAGLVVHAHAVDMALGLGLRPRWFGYGNLENFGAIGVDVFFAISGFIITKTAFLGESSPSAGKFLWQRWSRVAPIYFLLSLPAVIRYVLRSPSDWQRLIATYLFWPAFGAHVVEPVLSIGWTLCFEMLFYAGTWLLLLGRRRLVAAALIGVFVVASAARQSTGWGLFRFLGNPILLEFVFGSLIALLWKRVGQPRLLGGLAFGLGAILIGRSVVWGFGAISESKFTLDGTLSLQRVLVWGLPAALLVLGAVTTRSRADGPVIKAFAFLGDASYSLYLTHLNVIFVLQKVLRRSGSSLVGDQVVVLTILLAVAGGAIVYRWLELPILQALRRARQPLLQPGVALGDAEVGVEEKFVR